MSEPKLILAPSAAAAQQHDIPEGKHVAGHRIVVAGLYFAFDKKGEKVKREYREEFELEAHEHRLHGQGALGHILSDEKLRRRLSEKDPEFRAIQTHKVVAHENILVDAPRAEGEFRLGDKVAWTNGDPNGDAENTGVIVKLGEDGKSADVKLDINGNVSPFDLASLKLVPPSK